MPDANTVRNANVAAHRLSWKAPAWRLAFGDYAKPQSGRGSLRRPPFSCAAKGASRARSGLRTIVILSPSSLASARGQPREAGTEKRPPAQARAEHLGRAARPTRSELAALDSPVAAASKNADRLGCPPP